MERVYEINDTRSKKDFSRISFSGYKRTEVEQLLRKSILENKVEQAQYWCAELVCVGMFDKLWELFYLLVSKHIHIANPRVFPYLKVKYDFYEGVRSTGYHDYDLAMRNNIAIRECFAEIICVLCFSPKMPVLVPLKLKKKELSILNLQGRLQAETLEYGKSFLKKEDPEELLISMNELSYLCFEKSRQSINKLNDVLFWLHWVLSYEDHCRKNKISLECATREIEDRRLTHEYKKDVIWIVWDIILETNTALHDTKSDDTHNTYMNKTINYKKFINRILESLLFFFKLNFTCSCKSRKITLLYFAFQLLFMSIDMKIRLIPESERQRVEIIKSSVNLIYEKVKYNEVTPETDYLFGGIDESQSNREKTQKRLELLKNMPS